MRFHFFAWLMILAASEASACQCGRIPTPFEAPRMADAIFEGVLVDKRVVLGSDYGWVFPAVEYEFAVTRVWKGAVGPRIILLGGYSNCAMYFSGDVDYLVYAAPHWEKKGFLSSSICSRTQPVGYAAQDLRVLGGPTVTYRALPSQRRGIGALRIIRAYALSGVAGIVNLVRHPTTEAAWPGLVAVSVTITALIAFACSAVVLRWGKRFALLLFVIALLLASIGVGLTGARVLRNSYFARHIQWQLE